MLCTCVKWVGHNKIEYLIEFRVPFQEPFFVNARACVKIRTFNKPCEIKRRCDPLKKVVTITVCVLLLVCSASGQYFFRGEVEDGHGDKLQNVKITSLATKKTYRSNLYGGFGFSSPVMRDTLQFSTDGFEVNTQVLQADKSVTISMKSLPIFIIRKKQQLTSGSYKFKQFQYRPWSDDNESYRDVFENDFIRTEYVPELSFTANSNRAAYSNVRRLINEMEGALPPHAVRIEEMLNYFHFADRIPGGDSVFSMQSARSVCPWKPTHDLLFLSLHARQIEPKNLPPTNLVLLIDVSGSMEMPNKLPMIKAGLHMLIRNLRPIDSVSLVTFGGIVEILGEAIPGNEKKKLNQLIESLNADGPTPGEAGIGMAFQVARRHYLKQGNNRILLAADGDFNVGVSKEKQLENLVLQQNKAGIYLSCIGVGVGNYKDSKLAALAARGNGNFAYIDSEQEAERVMVSGFMHTLFTVADDVQITSRFNPQLCKSYRLIGFDNERFETGDTSACIVGGDIGSGHSVMALFEIERNDSVSATPDETPLALFNVSFVIPGTGTTSLLWHSCNLPSQDFETLASDYQKAACVALFGMKLRKSGYASSIKWNYLSRLASKVLDKKDPLEQELLKLIQKARKIYTHPRRYDSGY